MIVFNSGIPCKLFLFVLKACGAIAIGQEMHGMIFLATNMSSCWKMSEFKAHPVKAFLRVWAYLLILPNPVQRKEGDGKHRGLGSHCWATNTIGVYIYNTIVYIL